MRACVRAVLVRRFLAGLQVAYDKLEGTAKICSYYPKFVLSGGVLHCGRYKRKMLWFLISVRFNQVRLNEGLLYF